MSNRILIDTSGIIFKGFQGEEKSIIYSDADYLTITDISVSTIHSATNFKDTLTVEDATNLHKTLDVSGATHLHDRLDVSGATRLDNTLDVSGATHLEYTLDVSSATRLHNRLDVSGATRLEYTLDVSGATRLDNTLDVSGATRLDNTLDVSGATRLEYTLDVSGVTHLHDRLDVSGATHLHNTLDVSGATHLYDTLDVSGATHLHDRLDVSGATHLHDRLDISGATHLYDTLDVSGATHLHDRLDVSGNLDVSGATHLHNNLDVYGTLTAAVVDINSGAIDNTNIGANTPATGAFTTLEVSGVTLNATITELNVIDGDTSATSTTVAHADRVVLNDDGEMVQVAVTDLDTYFSGTSKTLTNKTLTAPVISTISNTGTLTLPNSTDTLVGRDTSDTLTNKELTSPIISTISNTGTLTLPNSTDTLVGKATTDTLTNKTLTSPTITGTGSIAGTFTGDITGDVSGTVSRISNHNTGSLAEGSNLYFTDTRVRNAISAGTGVSFSSGVISINQVDLSYIRVLEGDDVSGNIVKADGSGNLYLAAGGGDGGNAANANTVRLYSNDNSVGTFYIPFSLDSSGSDCSLNTDVNLNYDPSSNTLTVGDINLLGSSTNFGHVFTHGNQNIAGSKTFINQISVGNSLKISKNDSVNTLNNITGNSNITDYVLTTTDQIIGGDKTFTDNLTVAGSLRVTGTVTAYSSTNTTIKDQLIELGHGNTGIPTSTSPDSGIIINRGDASNVFMGWDENEEKFILGTTTSTGLSNNVDNFKKSTLVADISATDISCTKLNVADNLVVTAAGNVGIGTTNPSTKLEVVGDISANGSLRCNAANLGTITPDISFGSRPVMLKVIHSWSDTPISDAFVKLHIWDHNYKANGDINGQETRGAFMDFYAVPNQISPQTPTGYPPRRGVRINGRDGKVEVSTSVGTATLEVSSDDRIKHNEVDISNALTTVNKLKSKFYIKTSITDTCGNEYSRNHNFTSNGLPENALYESGYIAQDISNIVELNHLVSGSEYDQSGNPTALALNYIGIQPYLTKGIQELSVLNDEKTAQIASMQTTITDLLSRIATLESRI